MPTKRERQYYAMGFRDGVSQGRETPQNIPLYPPLPPETEAILERIERTGRGYVDITKPKRKLSGWQKYIKNKRNHIKYRDGKLNLKAMGVAYRRKKRR
jgi:hypothetical protein